MRRGMTLIELSTMIAVGATVLAGAFGVLVRLQRLAATDTGSGTRAELACELLRRDLAAGTARVEAGELRIRTAGGDIAWHRAAGRLLRGERDLIPVAVFAVAERDGVVAVDLVPAGLPPRRIEGRR